MAILLVLLVVKIKSVHQFGVLAVGEWWPLGYDVIVAIQVDDVFRHLAVGVSHTKHRCPDIVSQKLVAQYVAVVVASDVQSYLPILHVVQIFAPM